MSGTGQSPVDTVGTKSSKIAVELSTRFLEHFSEQLYSSPQKAFEELISNGWDAGAEVVEVRIADDLKAPGATMRTGSGNALRWRVVCAQSLPRMPCRSSSFSSMTNARVALKRTILLTRAGRWSGAL